MGLPELHRPLHFSIDAHSRVVIRGPVTRGLATRGLVTRARHDVPAPQLDLPRHVTQLAQRVAQQRALVQTARHSWALSGS